MKQELIIKKILKQIKCLEKGSFRYSLDIENNKLIFKENEDELSNIDLSFLLDNVNLSRIISANINNSGIITFIRDDESSFTLDISRGLNNKTSDLQNDGANGIDPFVSLKEVVINSTLDPNLAMPIDVGGFPAGTTIEDINGLSLTQYIEIKDFPTILAYIKNNKNLSVSGIINQNLEVGTTINKVLNIIFDKGEIYNGDNTVAGDLVGNLNNVIIKDKIKDTILITDNNPESNNINYDLLNYIIEQGINQFDIIGSYNEGQTVYTDNKGVTGTNLSIEKQAGNINVNSLSINGRYNRWYYVGEKNSSPNNSVGVRALNTNSLLSSTNTGDFNVLINAGPTNNEFSVYVPSGKIISVIDVGNLGLNITSDFIETDIIINNAANIPVNYKKFTRFAGTSGYANPTNFQITIS